MRRALKISAVLALCLFIAGPLGVRLDSPRAVAQETKPDAGEVEYGKEVTPEIKRAIDRGLKFMVSRQDMSTGAFESGDNTRLATTAICGIALLAGGHVPGRSEYGKNVLKALEFVLQCKTPAGYFTYGNSNMYSHGFATLFLAEVYGMLPPATELAPRVKAALRDGIDLIERVQDGEGGWSYSPIKAAMGGADMSVTVCETMALRAARNIGVIVDKRVVARAIQCVKNAWNQGDGGFSYRVSGGRGSYGSAFERSAGSVCILQSLGEYTAEQTMRGLDYLWNFLPKGDGNINGRNSFYFYGAYYSTQAMFMAGGERWLKWYKGQSAELLLKQVADGSWQDLGGGGGQLYGTGMALIVLEIPYRYLPILETTD